MEQQDEQARKMGALLKAHQEKEKAEADKKLKKQKPKPKQHGGSTTAGAQQRRQGRVGTKSAPRSSLNAVSPTGPGSPARANGDVPASQSGPPPRTLYVVEPSRPERFKGRGNTRRQQGGASRGANGTPGRSAGNLSGASPGKRGHDLQRLEKMPSDELVTLISRMEKQHKSLLEHMKSQLEAPPTEPPEPPLYHAISRTLWERVAQMQGNILSAIKCMILRDPAFSSRKKLPQRLWAVFYRELDVVQQPLRDRSSHGGGSQSSPKKTSSSRKKDVVIAPHRSPQAIRALLFGMIGEAEIALAELASSLQDIEDVDARSVVLYPLVMALGDLARYKQLHRPAGEGRDWSTAESHYHRAFRLLPLNGKAWNQQAIVATLRQDRFAAFYFYMRALCAEEPFPSKENVLALHDRWRRQVAAMHNEPLPASSSLSFEDHTHRFLSYLVVAAGTCISRSALANMDTLISATVSHLSSCLDIFGRGSERIRARMPAHLLRVSLLCVCVVTYCSKAWVDEGNDEAQVMKDDATRAALRLCFAVASVLADSGSALPTDASLELASESGVDGSGSAFSGAGAVMPAVCVFLDWLRCSSHMCEGMKTATLESQRFWTTMRSMCRFSSAVPLSLTPAPEDGLLSEDIECQGLLPLAKAIGPRLSSTLSAQEGQAPKDEFAGLVGASVPPASREAQCIRLRRLRTFMDWAVQEGWLVKSSSDDYAVPAGEADALSAFQLAKVPVESAPWSWLLGDAGGLEETATLAKGADNDDESPEALAVASALASLQVEMDLQEGLHDVDERAPALEGLLGMVMAGLGDADDRMCIVCCNTIGNGQDVCSLCGTPVSGAGGGASLLDQLGGNNAIFSQEQLPDSTEFSLGFVSRAPPGLPDMLAVGSPGHLSPVKPTSPPPPVEFIPPPPAEFIPPPPMDFMPDPSSFVVSEAGPPVETQERKRPLLVLDCPDIAMSHGLNKRFSVFGIQVRVQLWD
jgi:hypothetical protein